MTHRLRLPMSARPDVQASQTVLLAHLDAKRLPVELYALSRVAHRVISDCERMLERLHSPARQAWREAVGDALLASWQLRALAAAAGATADSVNWLPALETRLRDPQQRIVAAMTALLRHVPVSPEDELLLQDARAVRDAAADLLSVRHQGAARSAPVGDDGTDHQRPRVLVADDDSRVRLLLRRHLAVNGYEVLEADNGRDALELARREKVDLILSDIEMPHLDGIALLRELKAADATRDIPVIVISGQDDMANVTACIEGGAEDHIAKPYDVYLLRARARACVERKRLRDVEREYLRRVGVLTAAAQAVEDDRYVPGSLGEMAAHDDQLGRLTRVFDRMVSRLKSREERLRHRVVQLRQEMTQASMRTATPDVQWRESPFTTGAVLAQRYEILGQLGKGGMGMVYRARDLALGDDVAIKVVRGDLVAGDPMVVDRLKSEIRLARKISHPNVVRAHDLGEFEGTYFITMEYVNGITVEQIIDRRGRLAIESTLAVGAQLAAALAIAHEHEITHRDIKPANLLVDDKGVLKVMDFGIARSALHPEKLTHGGYIVGTPQYMAPEQLTGKDSGPQGDLFAAGVVLYECLTGRLPFGAAAPAELLEQMLAGSFVRVSEFVPDVPEALETLIYQLLRARADQRVGSARELEARLAEIDVAVRPKRASLLGEIDLEILETV